MSGTLHSETNVRTNAATVTATATTLSPNGGGGGGPATAITSNLSALREQPAHNGGERFRDIPELIETGPGIGQCITMRTEALGKQAVSRVILPSVTHPSALSLLGSYHQLGPPDLVHVIKTSQGGKNTKEVPLHTFATSAFLPCLCPF